MFLVSEDLIKKEYFGLPDINPNAVYFGFTRFSVYLPGSGAWVVSSTEDEYLTKLYSDERLKPRFEIFLERALPIYELYTKKFSYKHILLYSKVMPEKWKKLLFQAAEKYSFLILHEVRNTIYFHDVMEKYLIDNRKVDSPVALFRVDDDDILSADYLEQLSQYTDLPFEGMSVSFGNAIPAKYDNGKFTDFRFLRSSLLAIGLANIGRFDASTGKLIFPPAVNHMETDLHRPVIVDSRKPAFIWTHHTHQDSNHGVNGAGSLSPIEQAFLTYKTITVSSYLNSFPTVTDDFSVFINSSTVILSTSIEEKAKKFQVDTPVKFKPGNYRITYELELFESNASDSKCFIIFLGENSAQVHKLIGMTKSDSSILGWYRYINSVSGIAKGSFDIHINEEFSSSTSGIKGWNVKNDFYVKAFKIEKLNS